MKDIKDFLKYFFIDSLKNIFDIFAKGVFWQNVGIFLILFVLITLMPCRVVMSENWAYILFILGIILTIVGGMIRTYYSGVWKKKD